ncbi:MAG: hypothetical protein AAF125_23515 [Chloroflexota bacterium]
MLYTEELADGILQITPRGRWRRGTWIEIRNEIQVYMAVHSKPVYLLLNMISVTTVDDAAFRELVTSDLFGRQKTGLAILVGRRTQLHKAREMITKHNPNSSLRLMPRLDDAIRVLLDRQVSDGLQGAQEIGG